MNSDILLCLMICTLIGAQSAALQNASASARVAFSAGLTSSSYVAEGDVVLFDRIYTNIGNNYNRYTGTFTSPVAGTYVFHVSLLSQQNSRAWLKLYQNHQYKISIYEKDFNYYGGTGASVILQLRQNDQVYLKSAASTYLYGEHSDVYTLFSGYLLYTE